MEAKKKEKKKRKNTLDLYRAVYFMSGNTCSNEYGEKIVKIVKSINIHLVSWNFVKSAIFIVAYISGHK